MTSLPLSADQSKKALEAIAGFVKAQGASLRDEAAASAARLDGLKRKLEQRKATSTDVATLSLELMLWQMGALRAQYAGQLEALQTAPSHPAVADSKRALEALVQVLDRALILLRQKTPSPAATRQLQLELAEVERWVTKARESLSRTTLGVQLKPLARQPQSTSGVTLQPARPAAASARTPTLSSFKLRPGTLPPSRR